MHASYSFHLHCVDGRARTEAVSSGLTALIGFAARVRSTRFGIAFAATAQALPIRITFFISVLPKIVESDMAF